MKFRAARHTHQLQPIIDFYTKVIGFEELGRFENHSGYDGVYLGVQGENWHLEFTVSWHQPLHRPDQDDLLVFYPKDAQKYQDILNNMKQLNIKRSESQNPYWKKNGVTILDPDGYAIVIVKP